MVVKNVFLGSFILILLISFVKSDGESIEDHDCSKGFAMTSQAIVDILMANYSR